VQLLQVYPEGAKVNVQYWAFEDEEYVNYNTIIWMIWYRYRRYANGAIILLYTARRRVFLYTLFDKRA
jgi:hypothetical protein